MIYLTSIKINTLKGGFKEMSKVCEISGKGPLYGNKRSHSLHATRRRWNVNLQTVKVMVDGTPKKIRISARELRTLKAQGKLA
jgi:large subunit ribosomal protein L28